MWKGRMQACNQQMKYEKVIVSSDLYDAMKLDGMEIDA